MEATKPGFARVLLGQTVVGLSRVAIYSGSEHYSQQPLLIDSGTLIFALADGRRFELIEAQQADLGYVALVETPTDHDLRTTGELEQEPNESAHTFPSEIVGAQLPWMISSITEIWRPDDHLPFLIAIVLWNEDRLPLLCIYTGADDVSALPLDELNRRVLSLPFYYGSVLHHWYDV